MFEIRGIDNSGYSIMRERIVTVAMVTVGGAIRGLVGVAEKNRLWALNIF